MYGLTTKAMPTTETSITNMRLNITKNLLSILSLPSSTLVSMYKIPQSASANGIQNMNLSLMNIIETIPITRETSDTTTLVTSLISDVNIK